MAAGNIQALQNVTGQVSGSGTATKLPKWTGAAALGDSSITEEAAQMTSTKNVAAPLLKTTTALVDTLDGGLIPLLSATAIGATGGPATALMAGWMKIKDSTGADCWVIVWK